MCTVAVCARSVYCSSVCIVCHCSSVCIMRTVAVNIVYCVFFSIVRTLCVQWQCVSYCLHKWTVTITVFGMNVSMHALMLVTHTSPEELGLGCAGAGGSGSAESLWENRRQQLHNSLQGNPQGQR